MNWEKIFVTYKTAIKCFYPNYTELLEIHEQESQKPVIETGKRQEIVRRNGQ